MDKRSIYKHKQIIKQLELYPLSLYIFLKIQWARFKTFQFVQGQGQFCRIAELDSCQAARKGEGHGRPESTQKF